MAYCECSYEALNLFVQNQELILIVFITYKNTKDQITCKPGGFFSPYF